MDDLCVLQLSERGRAKAADRARDVARVQKGEASPRDIQRENSLACALGLAKAKVSQRRVYVKLRG